MKEKIIQELHAIDVLINKGKCQKALDHLQDLEVKNPKNKIIEFSKVGLLIDIGEGLENSQIVKKGISLGEEILKNPDFEKYKSKLYYNIANGYMVLHSLESKSIGIEQIVDNENLQRAKSYFREAIKEEDDLDLNFKKQLWTSYGNCLDTLRRGVEALYAYDEALKIDPNFSMALGNKARAMKFFANISGVYREAIYIKSYQMLKEALKDRNIDIKAKKIFGSEIQEIENLFEDKSILSKSLNHSKYDSTNMSEFEKYYIEFCSKHKLFLNFHIHKEECEASIVDPIFISLITPIDDDETFYNLAKYINQIKEDYAVARLLLVQSQFKKEDFDSISKRTTFANTPDYSIFNIYTGLLKSAFKEAYNILDKISRFINEYYGLGIRGDIYFTTIWQKEYYLFPIDPKLEDDLNKETISDKLRDEFKEKGYPVFSDATITKSKTNRWVIKINNKEKFNIRKKKRHLNVYKKKIRKKILNSKNISLYALYDIFLDFKSEYYRKIKDIRNASVHERLVIYDSIPTDWDKKDDKYNIEYETMLSQTIELFKLVKSAIIYLINFVNLEEEKKRKESGEKIGEIFFDTY